MSYSVEWIEPIYNRTYADILNAEENRELVNPIGTYNAIDLNRIENNTKYVMEDMLERKIIRVPPALAIKTNWTMTDIPTKDDMSRIIKNVQLLMDISNPVVFENFHIIYESTQFTYSLANAIEYNLDIMKNQPELPIQKWLLKVVNGKIVEYNTSTAYIAEEEIVHIQAVPYGEDAEYMKFNHWSGNTDDLQYVGNVNESPTTYQMQYHNSDNYEVEITANFKTRIPRTLALHGGVIYDSIGGTSRQFFAGEDILILANNASEGKVFYKWKGTQEGLDNLTGGEEPSTSWLTMPDCDVDLTSFYINAGKHKVTVDDTIQGWYNYDDYVNIYPSSKGDKYTFAYWSGDTGYLENVTSNSFKMPDVNVSFNSNWTYNYSYNTVDVIGGTINGATKGENLREGSGQSLIADAAPEGYVFDSWALEGVGSFADRESASTTFYVGDGNAVITANYVKAHTVTIENAGNTGGITAKIVGEGKKYSIGSTEVLTDYMFDHWDKDGARYSSSNYVENITMGTSDVTYTAVYRDRVSYTLTVNNGSGSGTYKERQSVSISANSAETGYRFSSWSGNYYDISNRYSSSTSITMPSADCTVTANYVKTHNVTVNNGSGGGSYYEGQTVKCYGNQAPDTWEFSHWEENGEIISYANPYTFSMGKSDRELTAVYKEIPYFTLTVINGSGSGTYLRNSSPMIIMDPAPEGMKFLQWEIVQGGENTVTDPLASTTRIRNLTENVTVKATYYIPNPEIQYTLTITDKEGSIQTSNHSIGEQVTIYADEPDEGYKFYKWVGDTQYLTDRYATPTIVNMPGKNITLRMEYRREGYTTMYHVILYGGELLVETDPETGEEKWDIEGEFEELSEVPIRAIDIPIGWKFNGWKDDDEKSATTVNDLTAEETFIIVEDFDIALTRDVIEKDKYSLTVNNGETSGSFYDDIPVEIYFNLENTDTVHYTFARWSGDDLAYIKLFDGGSFDIYNPGTGDEPQIIRMPARNITISAIYTTTYRLKITNGNISGETEGFYEKDTTVNVSANEPEEGQRFSHWIGNVEYVDNKYNPNITVTMPAGGIELTAVYVNKNNRNDVGLVNSNIYNLTSIDSTEIEIISGDLETGLIIIDIKGHMYVTTNINDTALTIVRLTKK